MGLSPAARPLRGHAPAVDAVTDLEAVEGGDLLRVGVDLDAPLRDRRRDVDALLEGDVDRDLDVVGQGEQHVDRLEVRGDPFLLFRRGEHLAPGGGDGDLLDAGRGDDIDDVLVGLAALGAGEEVDRAVACTEAVAVGE